MLLISLAFANGLTSHQWITLRAIEELPQGELRDLVENPNNRSALLSGALFPDGGYAVGDDYGERAHWEPFQTALLNWIVETDADDQHKAFVFGLTSHGMADQAFDAMYMERSKVYDAAYGWTTGVSMDEATDVALATAYGPGEQPELWYPDVVFDIYAEQGHTVDADTVESGTMLASAAIGFVGALAETGTAIEGYNAEYPWANFHMTDNTRCNPTCEAQAVARYWQALWDRFEGGDGWVDPVVGTIPADGESGQPIETGPEGRVAIIMARGLLAESVTTEAFTVTNAAGVAREVTAWLFYGQSSHIILLEPVEGWEADTTYSVTVNPGLVAYEGPTMTEAYTFRFDTFVVAEPGDTEDSANSGASPSPEPCGCSAASPGSVVLPGLLLLHTLSTRRGTRPLTS